MNLKRILAGLVAFVGIAGATALAVPAARAAICNTTVPLGAIAPAVPEWCQSLVPAVDTHVAAASAWVDEFNHGQTHARLSSAYVTGKANGDACDVLHFQHNDHWMADIRGDNGQYPTLCAAWMRPDRKFTGNVAVEFEFAGPIAGTRDGDELSDSWPEVVLTTAPQAGNLRRDGTYLYETFVGHWTFGCRMQQSKHPICSLYQPTAGPPSRPQREYEINQNGGDVTYEIGGGPHSGKGDAVDQAWNGCTSTQDPDLICRNHFRMEFTPTVFRVLVKDAGAWVLIYEAGLINDHLGNILNAPGGFYVYFGDFAYRISQDVVIRFHWDRLAVHSGVVPAPAVNSGGLPAPAVKSGAVPAPGSIGLLVATARTTPSELIAALANSGCHVVVLAISAGGTWSIYVNGAPPIINASFPQSLAAQTPYFVRC